MTIRTQTSVSRSAALRFLCIAGAVVVSIALMVFGVSAFRNLSGVVPAIAPVPKVSPEPHSAVNDTGLPLIVPDGFMISTFASGLGSPRVLAFDPAGTMLVSNPSAGTVLALPDADGNGKADRIKTVLTGLNKPHGLAFFGGRLYVAETGAVSSYAYDPGSMSATGQKHIVDLPSGGNHSTRTIGFGPDGKLYISVGSSCNVCVERDSRRAAMLVSNPDGSDLRVFASGLRNSVFFIWHPVSHELWATDMGRDLLGDDTPSEEVNIVRDGGFYGWPYCYEDKVWDRAFNPSGSAIGRCGESFAPQIRFQAHSAPLGLVVIPDTWPEPYRGNLLVAYHGSWNRTVPTGYKIERFVLDAGFRATGESEFLTGFLQGNSAIGRPVSLIFNGQGNLYVSDDKAGNVYRIEPIRDN